MKKLSVKVKITVLLTTLMAILSSLLLIVMLIISSTVAKGTAMETLSDTVRSNLQWIEMTERKPNLGEGFHFYHSGVNTLIYSQHETLLAGQIPVSFDADVDFQNGTVRTVETSEGPYMVLDVWLPSDWEHGVWVRGVMAVPDSHEITSNLLKIALVTLPTFMLLAGLGSYRIIKRSFRPLDTITAAAEAINEARDLSGRIGLPPGNDEFSRLASDFDNMFERLERSFEAEKQFTADASHELRTPVSIIKGACEFAERYDETPEDHQETISMIHRQADKMSTLISQLLSITRMEQETEPLSMEKLDLGDAVNTFIQEHDWNLEQMTIDSPSGIFVHADGQLLGRLLRNLVENAFKYGKEDGHVWLSVTCNAKEAALSVRDDGIGIPKEEQEKIWQRFYQVDSSRSTDEGAGLGLSMVQQIARIHGGYMSLESTPGEGSTFTLHLPLASEKNNL